MHPVNESIMTLQEAIVARHSVRQYLEKPIESEKVAQLQALIDECNKDGQLHLQLVTNEPKAFASGMAKYGGFKGIGYAALDLGIAKCHFEIGAGEENFSWA